MKSISGCWKAEVLGFRDILGCFLVESALQRALLRSPAAALCVIVYFWFMAQVSRVFRRPRRAGLARLGCYGPGAGRHLSRLGVF